ncbi:saccharopine dehydrogenase family protein [Frankia tisae]|uniref:saccharopine dehydrogenase family protein n=1 Tax=Frankia tisae TaxID=2950104 RepID=UPI0021C212A6|nr:saccharopine dehydrogenase NADP-binding domain-containing protein [Frankia tisae]
MAITVYGASGYTGRLVAAELRRRGFSVVLAGRDGERLRALATELGDTEPGDSVDGREVEIGTRQVGIDDPAALADAFRGSEAVVNVAGPFTLVGEPVVRAAIEAGTHYLDTTAEQLFVQKVFDEFSGAAENAGVTVLPATGFYIVPGDLLANVVGTRVGRATDLLVAYDVHDWDMSRGTVRSAFGALTSGSLVYSDGGWRPGDGTTPYEAVAFPGNVEPTPVINWAGPEVVTVPRHVPTDRVSVVISASVVTPEFGQLLQLPAETVATIIDNLPEGPEVTRRPAAGFTIVAEATGADGRRARGVLQGHDIYGSTAVIAVESVRRLLAQPPRPGVLTPAQAFDAADFLDTLIPHGYSWNVEAPAGSPAAQ